MVARWSRGREFGLENLAVERLLDPLTSFELLAGGGILDALASERRHIRIRRHAWIEVMRCPRRVGIIATFLQVLHARIHLGWGDSRSLGFRSLLGRLVSISRARALTLLDAGGSFRMDHKRWYEGQRGHDQQR